MKPGILKLTGWRCSFASHSHLLRTAYYFQAASGQWKLMRARQDIDDVLLSADTNPELANRLRTARDILEFAETSLILLRVKVTNPT